MNVSFYTAAVGATAQQNKLNVQANNIANIGTYGFKAKRPAFASLMYDSMTGIDDRQLPRGNGTHVVMADTDLRGGSLTGSSMLQSYAIDGEGFFALMQLDTGDVSYTRDGSFTIAQMMREGEDGEPEEVFYLSDGRGRLVLSRTGAPIEVVDRDYTYPVGVFDFVNRNGMQNIGGNRFQPVDKNGQVRMGAGNATRGMLENSNADLTSEITQVIEAQRSFSYALKMIQTSDEIESTINGLSG